MAIQGLGALREGSVVYGSHTQRLNNPEFCLHQHAHCSVGGVVKSKVKNHSVVVCGWRDFGRRLVDVWSESTYSRLGVLPPGQYIYLGRRFDASAGLAQRLAIESASQSDGSFGVDFLAVFEYLRLVLEDQSMRFTWALLIFMFIFSYTSFLAFSISYTHQLKSGRLLAVVYGIGAIVLYVRMLRVYYGYTEPDVVAHGIDSLLVVFSGFLAAVFGNFSFVGMFLERTRKKEIAAVEERARQEESARLADEIAQLERQRTLGMMSYSFAHEFSQLLTAILMDAHSAKTALAAEQLDVRALNEAIEDIERNANRSKDLIDRIRNFIRPSAHELEKVDMKVLTVEVKQLLMHDIRHQNIEFEWEFENEDCVVMGDKVQLSQILLNVYRNAIQAIAESNERKIFVYLGQQDNRVVVRMRDTVPGLTEELKLRVGIPFVSTKMDGLGVGLSISKSIA